MATETTELDKDAFMRLVTEEHLQVEGPSGGYLYTGKRGRNGWELFKTANNPWYVYQARRVCTAGVGGGAMRVRVNIPAGTIAKLLWVQVLGPASAGSSTQLTIMDEDDAITTIATVAAVANANLILPVTGAPGTTAIASGSMPCSLGWTFTPSQKVAANASVSLQNETLTVVVCWLQSTDTVPVWDTTGSVATCTLADSSISAANSMIMVAMP